MNYGKKKASQKQKKITSKKSMQGKRVGVRLFKAADTLRPCTWCCWNGWCRRLCKKILDNTPEVSPEDVKPKEFTTFVYADDGATEIERFVASGSNRVYKPIDQIPRIRSTHL